jgi:hypothetical protein
MYKQKADKQAKIKHEDIYFDTNGCNSFLGKTVAGHEGFSQN